MSEPRQRIAVVGGGAAGYFGAIACARALQAAGNDTEVVIFEGSEKLLAKVRISGGGRCNVTNACQDPRELVKSYPRGGKELRGPLTRFGPRETVAWFEERGAKLKTEPDGRMFPVTDESRTIVLCLKDAAREAGVRVRVGLRVDALAPATGGIDLRLADGTTEHFVAVLLATGGARPALKLATDAGHAIESPVPSLFTFKVNDERLDDLAGVAFEKARLRLRTGKDAKPLEENGPLLITHWGLSGPAVLRLSAWGARALEGCGYRAKLSVCFLPGETEESLLAFFQREREQHPKRTVRKWAHPAAPRRFWERLCYLCQVTPDQMWTELAKRQMQYLARELAAAEYEITGKGEFKEEFVTCGGVRLKEVDFRTMESKLVPGLYFAGEVLDIDAITGGFNFQAAWTTGHLAGSAIAASLLK